MRVLEDGAPMWKIKNATVRSEYRSYKNKIIAYISADPILRGVLIIGSSSALSQVLQIVFVPILTRIYPPAIYGTLSVFSSLVSILIVMGSFRYNLTIPLAKTEEDAENLLVLSSIITGLLTFILIIVLILFGEELSVMFNFEFLSPYFWLLGISFCFLSAFEIITGWVIRSKDYGQIARTRIIQSISGQVSKIILGIFSFGSFGLIIGELLGTVVGVGLLGRTIIPKLSISIRVLKKEKIIAVARDFKKFPQYTLPSAFINVLALQAPILLISTLFGFQMVGLYSLSYSMLVMPVSLVSSALGQVYYGEISELCRLKSQDILAFYQKTTKRLFVFGAPIIFIGALISPVIFPLIFGSAWKDAGMFSLPLSFMVIAQFVISPTQSLPLYGYNHWELAWNIGRTVSVFAGFFLAYYLGLSPVATVLIYSLIITGMYAVNYMMEIKAINLFQQAQSCS